MPATPSRRLSTRTRPFRPAAKPPSLSPHRLWLSKSMERKLRLLAERFEQAASEQALDRKRALYAAVLDSVLEVSLHLGRLSPPRWSRWRKWWSGLVSDLEELRRCLEALLSQLADDPSPAPGDPVRPRS